MTAEQPTAEANAADLPNRQGSVITRLKEVGDARDGVLVTASCVYLVGYATWAVFCWRHKLGAASALDMQYFVIGGPVALAFAFVLAVIWASKRALAGLRRRYYGLSTGVRSAVLMVASGGATVAATVKALAPNVSDAILLPIALLFMFVQVLVAGRGHKVPLVARLFVVVASFYLAFSFITFYVTVVYERIPQAFGGGRPRHAVLDLKRSELSPEMLQPVAASRLSSGGVVRSKEVRVLARPSDSIIIVVPSSNETIELKMDTIAGIVWRD